MQYPTSNVRVIAGFTLTESDFNECGDCADGNHGLLESPICICCRWPSNYKAGVFVHA